MKKFFCVSLVAALSLLLFSCSNFFSSSSSDNESAPNGKARVHFSVGKTDARTIMPEIYTEEDISLVELTAQKKGEETAYKFNGEKEKLSWTSLAALENVSIDIDYGTYTFVLNLSIKDEEENKTVLVQTCTLENQEINADTKELVFNMEEDSGDVSIAVSWGLGDETNRIGKIGVGLYTIASNGETTIGISDAEKTLTIKGADTSVTATGSYASVPSGSYLIKLFLYDSESSTTPFNTITDIIKVNGYKTLYDLKLDPNELNVQYEAVFDPNGGTWGDNTTEPKTVLRNAYSGFVPPEDDIKHSTDANDELGLVGWYTFPDDRIPENPEELGISGGTSYERIAREDYAQDYKFFAIWGKKTGGKLIKDNRALIIKTDIVDGKIYQNSKINLSVTDSNGKTVTDAIKYDAKILYKGKDINERTVDGCPYYQAEGKEIFLRGLENPIPKEKYQLYVTASRDMTETEQVTSSQTFDVELVEGLATPETQVALYNYDSGSYKYYLKDSNKVDEELGEQTLGANANMAKSAFDASGYFYVAYKDNYGSDGVTIYSNNPANPGNLDNLPFSSGVQLPMEVDSGTSFSSYYSDFAIDLTTNILYGCAINGASLYLFKYPNLISSASTEGYVAYDYINAANFNPNQIAINDNTLYILGYYNDNDSGTDNETWQVMVYDIPESTTFGTAKYTCDLDSMLIAKDSKLEYAKYSQTDSSPYGDIYAMDGALYLVLKPFTAWTVSNPNIYSGAIVKWVPGESEVTVRGLYSEKTVAQESITQMYLNTERGNPPQVYSASDRSELKTMLADSTSYNNKNDNGEYYGIEDGYKFFPNVYAMSANSSLLDKTGFVGPAKIIGIKPKKLVIADDGYAFYTDSDMLYYKNVNRVVTIDLEQFVIESVQATEATFDSELTDYFKSGATINDIRSGGTYYDYAASIYYYDASGNWQSGQLRYDYSNLYLAVKEGVN